MFHNKVYLLYAVMSISFLTSCQPKDTFDWNAGFSAPKNYIAGGPYVEYFYKGISVAGISSNMGINPGWEITSGGYVGGDKFKPIPDSISVSWTCGFDLIEYKGGYKLPREKMLKLFQKKSEDIYANQTQFNLITTGMAPGGNVTVWLQGGFANTEICKFKTQAIGKQERYDKNSISLWTSTGEEAKEVLKYIYVHGIPYKIWETGEKEFQYDIGFTTEDENKKDYSIAIAGYTKDGSVIYSNRDPIPYVNWNEKINLEVKSNKKLPVQFYLQWISKDNQEWYEAQIVLPNNLENRFLNFRQKYGKDIFVIVGIDKVLENKSYAFGRIWLENYKKKIEIMKFRAAKLNVLKTRIKKYEVSKYSLPKGFVFPKWEGREPLTKPSDFEYWQEK